MSRAFLALILIGLALGAQATTHTAANWSEVQAKHDHVSCVNGDTIEVTGGTYEQTTKTTITKYVRIVCVGGTCDISNSVAATDDFLDITESTAGSTRFEGDFHISENQHSGLSGLNATIQIHPVSGGKPVVIKGITFNYVTKNVIYNHSPRGLITGNIANGIVQGAQCLNNAAFVRHKPSWDSTSWTRPATFGNADTTGEGHCYIENNTLTDIEEGIDVDDMARTVVRFNTMTNSVTLTHGDTSFPGGRYFEFLFNTCVRDASLKESCNGGTLPTNFAAFLAWRAGTGFVIGNVIPDINDGYWGNKTEIVLRVDGLQRSVGGPGACWEFAEDGVPYPAQTGWGYITGATEAGTSGYFYDREPIYIAANTGAAAGVLGLANYGDDQCGNGETVLNFVQADREYFNQTGSFDGTSGTGTGTRASRPASTTNGVAYWATDQGGNWNTSNGSANDGCLDIVVGGAWSNCVYTPASYPHALTDYSSPAATPAPNIIGGKKPKPHRPGKRR